MYRMEIGETQMKKSKGISINGDAVFITAIHTQTITSSGTLKL